MAHERDQLMIERGKSWMIVSENGNEFTGNDSLGGADTSKVEWH